MPTDQHAILIKSVRFEEVYDIKEEVGRGQFAVVHRVVRRRDGAEFAAKVMRKRSKNPNAIDYSGVVKPQVEQEVRILLMLDHPNVIKLIEAYEEKHCFILVFEFLRGGELFSKMLTRGRFSEAETVFYLREILCALKHLHSKDIVHLDIKPENVMLGSDENSVKIIDFGLSRIINAKYVTRDMVGTPEFVAPEVINYDDITLATDMWSVGVLTYILLTGYSPFLGRTQAETYERVNEARCQLDGPHFAGVSDYAKDFVRRLIRRTPKERANVAQCLQHSWLTSPVPDSLVTDIANVREVVVVAQRLEINDSPSSGTSSPALTDRASIVSATSAMSRDASLTASNQALASTSYTPPPDADQQSTSSGHQSQSRRFRPSGSGSGSGTEKATPPTSSSAALTMAAAQLKPTQRSHHHHHHHHHHRESAGGDEQPSASTILAEKAAKLRSAREPIVLLRPIPEQQSLLISARGNLKSSKSGQTGDAPSSAAVSVQRKPSNRRQALAEQLKKLKPRTRSPNPDSPMAEAATSPIPNQRPSKQLSGPSLAQPEADTTAGEDVETPTVSSTKNLSLKITNSPRLKAKKKSSSSTSSQPAQHSPNAESPSRDQVFDSKTEPNHHARQFKVLQSGLGQASIDEDSAGDQRRSAGEKLFRLTSADELLDKRKNSKKQHLSPSESDTPIKRSNSPKEALVVASRGSPAVYLHTDDDSSSAFESAASSAAFESIDNLATSHKTGSSNQQLTLTTSSLSHLHLVAGNPSPGSSSAKSASPRAGAVVSSSATSSSTTLSERAKMASTTTITTTTTSSPNHRKLSKKQQRAAEKLAAEGAPRSAEARRQSGGQESSAMRLLRKLSGKQRGGGHKTASNNRNHSPEVSSENSETTSSTTVIAQTPTQKQPPANFYHQTTDFDVFTAKSNSMSLDMLQQVPENKLKNSTTATTSTTANRNLADRRTSSTPTAEMMMLAAGGGSSEPPSQRSVTSTMLLKQSSSSAVPMSTDQQVGANNPSIFRWLIGKVITTSSSPSTTMTTTTGGK